MLRRFTRRWRRVALFGFLRCLGLLLCLLCLRILGRRSGSSCRWRVGRRLRSGHAGETGQTECGGDHQCNYFCHSDSFHVCENKRSCFHEGILGGLCCRIVGTRVKFCKGNGCVGCGRIFRAESPPSAVNVCLVCLLSLHGR